MEGGRDPHERIHRRGENELHETFDLTLTFSSLVSIQMELLLEMTPIPWSQTFENFAYDDSKASAHGEYALWPINASPSVA